MLLGLANDPPEKCFDLNGRGELPTCTYDGSRWEVTYPGSGSGLPDWVVPLVVLAVLACLALLVWRLARARRPTPRPTPRPPAQQAPESR